MPNHLKFCGCRSCRAGMHRGGGFIVRRAIRKARRKAKIDLKNGREPVKVISVPYTD